MAFQHMDLPTARYPCHAFNLTIPCGNGLEIGLEFLGRHRVPRMTVLYYSLDGGLHGFGLGKMIDWPADPNRLYRLRDLEFFFDREAILWQIKET